MANVHEARAFRGVKANSGAIRLDERMEGRKEEKRELSRALSPSGPITQRELWPNKTLAQSTQRSSHLIQIATFLSTGVKYACAISKHIS